MPSPARPVAERMWEKVSKGTEDQCWEWRGARASGRSNYGVIRSEGKTGVQYVHRIAFESANGWLPNKPLMVRHLCGNKICCNPNHLASGTARDNTHDRKRAGEIGGLMPEDVVELREYWKRSKRPIRHIAADLGMNYSTVFAAIKGQNFGPAI